MPDLSEQEKNLCDAIATRDAQMRSELAEHVAIPTGKDYVPGMEKYRAMLIETLTKVGATIEIAEGDTRPSWLEVTTTGGQPEETTLPGAPIVIASRHVNDTSPRILIAGHLDTVHDPFGSFRELTIDPDGVIARGPGVVDMKGGVLITMHALATLAEAGIDLNWTVLLNSDEETGSFRSARVLREQAKKHDLGICVEPALPGGALAVERMGSGQFMIEVFGQSAHVGREFEKGISAVNTLAKIVLQLAKLAKPKKGAIVNVGPLRGGGATNAVPDYAACWGNVRYRDPQVGEKLGEAIDALATNGDALPRVIVHRMWNRPAKPKNEHVMKIAKTVRAAGADLGQSIEFVATGGVCDGNIMQDAGLPTIDTLGVRGGNLHRPDEFIELPSLVERCQLLAVVLSRLATQP